MTDVTTARIYVTRTGMWFSEFEYRKHQKEEYPDAVVLTVLEQGSRFVQEAYNSAMAGLLAKELE